MLNEYQQKLFNDLTSLVASSEAFFVTKTKNPITGTSFWMFNYRLPSYTDFQNPSALEARGIMFEIDSNGSPVELASLPMFKFFNIYENPSVMELNLELVERIEVKADGSLISTYMDKGNIYLKTKGSLISEQAICAQNWIQKPEHSDMWNTVQHLTYEGYTVNMEWTSPLNRIVLPYQDEKLFILNVRNNQTGAIYSSIETLQNICSINVSHLKSYWIDNIPLDKVNKQEFVQQIDNMQGIEGYIVKFSDGKWVKVKTTQYRELHKTKDSINNNKALYACIVNEAADELRSMFYDDEFALNRINIAENHVSHHFNHMVRVVEDFYENNKNLTRKDYAVKGQKELDRHVFVIAMEKYIGRDVDYKSFMLKYYDIYPLPMSTIETI